MLWFSGERWRGCCATCILMENELGFWENSPSTEETFHLKPLRKRSRGTIYWLYFSTDLYVWQRVGNKIGFPRPSKGRFLDFAILKMLISRHLAFQHIFYKPGSWRAGKSVPIFEMLSNIRIGWKIASENGTFNLPLIICSYRLPCITLKRQVPWSLNEGTI